MDHLAKIKRILALAQTGLAYTESDYDKDRYLELEEIALGWMSTISDHPIEKVKDFFPRKPAYATPMVDVRAVILNADKNLLMVRERADGKWALPGGWADIGYSPMEIAEKEAFEEAGVKVKASRLLSVFDKKHHEHPPEPYYVYKIFIACELVSGEVAPGHETLDAGFFDVYELPELSVDRNTEGQIQKVLEILDKDLIATVD